MPDYGNNNGPEASLGLNVPDNLWEIDDPFLCLATHERMLLPHADTYPQTELSGSVQQQNALMENVDFESETCLDSSKGRSMTGLYRGYDSGMSQADVLPSSSSINLYDPGEHGTISHTDKELSITVGKLTSTIKEFGDLSRMLDNKVDRLNSRFDDLEERCVGSMERSLGTMERRMDKLTQNVENLSRQTEGLETKFQTVNDYLLEVIRREQMVMQEFGDLASHYHERERAI
ncbi:uncharacterized protein N7515_010223 [Penicillium bovifimosum]|uniref:Uncharacterized protein n=1 Tax=Penicillium bovifimosum TaxID=126998 RepID=A0A9W9GIE3_9EURO|nr:uncharacterized protein N7515_010223 [Penicillium bovifimosum]KAJ5120835.1 hypothetical protein N7515_010223 [Penicillium bovifimosum]